MPEVKLTAELRTEFGKGAARRIRRAHKVPAVLYGHGTDPIHITLPGHETLLALRTANALLSINVNGKSQLALPKQVQRDPLKHTIEHVDLVIVRPGEKVTVDVPIHVEGEAASETLVVVDRNSITVEAEATHIPTQIVLSIEGLPAGTQIQASDLELPEGSTLGMDPDTLIVNITARAVGRSRRGRAGRSRGRGRHRADGRRGDDTGRGARRVRVRARGANRLIDSSCSPGWWSGSAIPARPTRVTGTTSATGWSRSWRPGCRRASRSPAASAPRSPRVGSVHPGRTRAGCCWPSRGRS